MSVPRSVIHLIFFSCLGQLVETFRELQFCAEQVRFCKIVVRVRAAGRGPPAAGLGDRADLGTSLLLHGVQGGRVQERSIRV